MKKKKTDANGKKPKNVSQIAFKKCGLNTSDFPFFLPSSSQTAIVSSSSPTNKGRDAKWKLSRRLSTKLRLNFAPKSWGHTFPSSGERCWLGPKMFHFHPLQKQKQKKEEASSCVPEVGVVTCQYYQSSKEGKGKKIWEPRGNKMGT